MRARVLEVDAILETVVSDSHSEEVTFEGTRMR